MIIRWHSDLVNTKYSVHSVHCICDKPYHTNKRIVQNIDEIEVLRNCAWFGCFLTRAMQGNKHLQCGCEEKLMSETLLGSYFRSSINISDVLCQNLNNNFLPFAVASINCPTGNTLSVTDLHLFALDCTFLSVYITGYIQSKSLFKTMLWLIFNEFRLLFFIG